MELDRQACYRAIRSKDRRYDGRFFTAVVTTGIYCRPVCPARTPRLENVRFLPSAAAAERAGFRACRRCRPERSPPWRDLPGVVEQALRLIHSGVLDEGSVEELAAFLGVGSRHLRRLFREHVGATPAAVAQTRRVHFARRLIDETRLTMTQIAANSGFSSIRRFNFAVKQAFGDPPSVLRQRRSRSGTMERPLELRLSYRPPLPWGVIADFLRPRAIPGVEAWKGEVYSRVASIEGVPFRFDVDHDDERKDIRVRFPRLPEVSLMRIAERLRRMFDLDCSPEIREEHWRLDPILGATVRAIPGLRVPGAFDVWETAVRVFLGQQISVAAATTLTGTLVAMLGTPFPEGAGWRLFPEASEVANASVLPPMPVARKNALQAFARAVSSGDVLLDAGNPNLRKELLAIPGLGPWTADCIAMRLGDPDALPAADLGIRKALAIDGARPSVRAVESVAESWKPWRSYAAITLWHQTPAVDSIAKDSKRGSA